MQFLQDAFDIYRPDEVAANVWSIDFKRLVANEIWYFISDLDGTLANKDSDEIDPRSTHCLDTTLNPFGIKGVCVLSNMVYGNQENDMRLISVSRQLGAERVGAYWPNLKNGTGPFEQAKELMGSNYKNTAVIGDQLLTDIYGGNKSGLYTILVPPLPGSDHFFTKPKRLLEKFILSQLGITFPTP